MFFSVLWILHSQTFQQKYKKYLPNPSTALSNIASTSSCRVLVLECTRTWVLDPIPGTHAHIRVHACTHARMHACTHARMHACTYTLLHTRQDLEIQYGIENPAWIHSHTHRSQSTKILQETILLCIAGNTSDLSCYIIAHNYHLLQASHYWYGQSLLVHHFYP